MLGPLGSPLCTQAVPSPWDTPRKYLQMNKRRHMKAALSCHPFPRQLGAPLGGKQGWVCFWTRITPAERQARSRCCRVPERTHSSSWARIPRSGSHPHPNTLQKLGESPAGRAQALGSIPASSHVAFCGPGPGSPGLRPLYTQYPVWETGFSVLYDFFLPPCPAHPNRGPESPLPPPRAPALPPQGDRRSTPVRALISRELRRQLICFNLAPSLIDQCFNPVLC